MNGLLHVSSSPHARSKVTTDKIMFAVLLALAPAACVGVWNFGLRALLLIAISMAVCPLTEYLYEKGMKKPVTIADGSALVTGLLLAMNMPVQAPLWMPVIGGVFAILVVKQLFGGLGQNIMNPALAGRCFLLISFPGHMTNFAAPAAAHLVDTVSGATPLAAAKAGEQVNLLSMFFGNTAGTIGETSALALLIGGIFLVCIHVIDLNIPLIYIGTELLFALLFGGHGFDSQLPWRASFGRRSDARRMVHGNRLRYPPDHKEGTVYLCGHFRSSDRRIPYLWKFGRGRFLCHHLYQPSGSAH